MSSSSWQDRRFMFPTGKEVHQGSSGYVPTEKETPPTVIPTSTSPPASTEKVIPSWEGDRRFMFPTGKQIHEPARRLSASSGTSGKAAESATKATAAPATAASPQSAIASAIAGRRRVCNLLVQPFHGCGSLEFAPANRFPNSHLRPQAGCSAALWHDVAATNTTIGGRVGKT